MTADRIPAELLAAIACADCDSDVTATMDNGVVRANIAHDPTCPWHQQVSHGQPFTVLAIPPDPPAPDAA
jgi:hypothetical protein